VTQPDEKYQYQMTSHLRRGNQETYCAKFKVVKAKDEELYMSI
jgi:hypothetical protein